VSAEFFNLRRIGNYVRNIGVMVGRVRDRTGGSILVRSLLLGEMLLGPRLRGGVVQTTSLVPTG
jgi:hypothetical protein